MPQERAKRELQKLRTLCDGPQIHRVRYDVRVARNLVNGQWFSKNICVVVSAKALEDALDKLKPIQLQRLRITGSLRHRCPLCGLQMFLLRCGGPIRRLGCNTPGQTVACEQSKASSRETAKIQNFHRTVRVPVAEPITVWN